MIKRGIVFLAIAVLTMGLAACGTNGTDGTSGDSENNSSQTAGTAGDSQTADEETADEEQNTAGDTTQEPAGGTESADGAADTQTGKTLVVYYSATGNTKAVAELIAQQTDGDLFELIPTEIYTDEDLDWRDSDSRVSVEHDDTNARDVELTAETVDNWAEYDTVYIGYPIWWGIAAWPVDTFVKANDFTGKTVIPFATAASSGMGQSGELLQELAGTGDWLEGECFRGRTSDEDISDWLSSFQ